MCVRPWGCRCLLLRAALSTYSLVLVSSCLKLQADLGRIQRQRQDLPAVMATVGRSRRALTAACMPLANLLTSAVHAATALEANIWGNGSGLELLLGAMVPVPYPSRFSKRQHASGMELGSSEQLKFSLAQRRFEHARWPLYHRYD